MPPTRAATILLSAALLAPIPAQAPPPPEVTVDHEFALAMPPLAESRWTLIPWRPSLTAALAESRRTRKPVFLYVNDGEVASGRC